MMPSGTATMAAMMKPPTTRQTVMPISPMKPKRVSSSQPSCTMVIGSARKVRETKPPSVAKAQAATNRTKKEMPSVTRVPWLTGSRGRGMKNLLCRPDVLFRMASVEKDQAMARMEAGHRRDMEGFTG